MGNMIGFVAVMSSVMAVLLLVMSSFMLNILDGLKNNVDNPHLQDDLSFVRGKVDSDGDSDNIDNAPPYFLRNVLPQSSINDIKNKNNLKSIVIHCSYGNNLSNNTADKFLIFNYINLKRTISNVDISFELLKDREQFNKCWLTFEYEES